MPFQIKFQNARWFGKTKKENTPTYTLLAIAKSINKAFLGFKIIGFSDELQPKL
jgi:hypothetical protein